MKCCGHTHDILVQYKIRGFSKRNKKVSLAKMVTNQDGDKHTHIAINECTVQHVLRNKKNQ